MNNENSNPIRVLKIREKADQERLESAMKKLIELGDVLDSIPIRERQHLIPVLHTLIERANRPLPIDKTNTHEASLAAHAYLAMLAMDSD